VVPPPDRSKAADAWRVGRTTFLRDPVRVKLLRNLQQRIQRNSQTLVFAMLEKIGADPVNAGPAEFLKRIKADTEMWSGLIQQTGIKIQ
jgi:hypothetical protein